MFPSPPRPSNKNRRLWILAGIIGVGISLRAYQLTARSLWFDEAFSWRLIQFPISEMVTRAATDVHPILYYLFLKAWAVVFGTGLLSLRSFSVAAAALTIAAMYGFVAYALRSRRAGLLAAALYAVSGWQIAFAWEARMYTLGTVFAIISSWLLLAAIRPRAHGRGAVRRRPQAMWWYVGYALAAAALLHTHYYGIFTVAAQALWLAGVILFESRGRIGEMLQSKITWYALLSGIIIAALFAPWLPTFLRQNAQVQQQYWIPPLSAWSIPDTFYRMAAPTSGEPIHSGPGIALTIMPLAALALAATILIIMAYRPRLSGRATQGTFDAASLLVMLAGVPFIISISLSLVSQSIYNDRFFVFANLFVIAIIAGVSARLRPPALHKVVSLLLVVGSLAAFVVYMRELNIPAKPGARAATQYAVMHGTADEIIIVNSSFIYFSILHYVQEAGSGREVKLLSDTGELVHFAGGPILKPEDIIGPQVWEDSSRRTIWVVDSTGFGGIPLNPPPPFKKIDSQSYPEVFPHQGNVIVTKYMK